MSGAAPEGDQTWLGPERLLAFSDGVIAIALTLLVLPLADLVPEAAEPEGSGLTLITENLAPIATFVLSFVVIARFWAAHHRAFDGARRVGPVIVWLNTAWLFTIVVLPFPTEMLGSFPEDPFTLRFYVGTMFVSSALLTVMTIVTHRAQPAGERGPARHSAWVSTPGLLFVIFLGTLVAPGLGYWPLLLLFAVGPVERLLRPVFARRPPD